MRRKERQAARKKEVEERTDQLGGDTDVRARSRSDLAFRVPASVRSPDLDLSLITASPILEAFVRGLGCDSLRLPSRIPESSKAMSLLWGRGCPRGQPWSEEASKAIRALSSVFSSLPSTSFPPYEAAGPPSLYILTAHHQQLVC